MPQPVQTRGLVGWATRVAGVIPSLRCLPTLSYADSLMLSMSVVTASHVSRSGSPICGFLSDGLSLIYNCSKHIVFIRRLSRTDVVIEFCLRVAAQKPVL